jgi:hypothetical protein
MMKRDATPLCPDLAEATRRIGNLGSEEFKLTSAPLAGSIKGRRRGACHHLPPFFVIG